MSDISRLILSLYINLTIVKSVKSEFKDAMNELPVGFRATSIIDMGFVREYFDAVQRYVTSAEQHAKSFGFGLLLVNLENGKLSPELKLDSYIYGAGVGDVTIESAERFERFLDMVKTGSEKLDEQYASVLSAGQILKSGNKIS